MKKYSTFLVAFLFPVIVFAQDSTWFSDGTAKAGLTGAKAFRINVVDINSDDYPDMMLINSQGSISTQQKLTKLYLNIQNPASASPKDRVFKDITEGSGIFESGIGDTGRVFSCATMGDFNNDGNMDIVTGTWYHKLENFLFPDDRCDIMLGDGQGHFTLVANSGLHNLGLISASGFTLLDFDLDGNLDIFIPTSFKDLTNDVFMQSFLMKGRGDGTFENVSVSAGMGTSRYPLQGASSTDWNNDGFPDILTSAYCRSGGSVWKNNGNGTFSDAAPQIGYSSYVAGDGQQPACQWAAQPADFDNDGDMDLSQVLVHGGLDANEARTGVTVNQGAQNNFKLQRDYNRLIRDNVSRSTHLGDYDGSWIDLDNDGKLDFTVAQGGYMPATDRTYFFRQNDTGRFEDITPETGMLWLKETHNIRPIDYDLDGDEDLLIELLKKGNQLVLIDNNIGSRNNWSTIKLIAPPGVNKNAVGARITLYSGGTAQIREVQLGQGHFGAQQSVVKSFGIAQNAKIDSIVVRWPAKSMANTVVYDAPANQLLKISAQGITVVSVENENNLTERSFEIYPNPAQNKLSVQLPQGFTEGTLEICNQLGVKMYEMKTFSAGVVTLSVENFPRGMYLLKGLSKGGKLYTQTFVKD